MISTTTRGLLDTSTLLLLGRLQDTTALPEEPLISVVTLAELSVGPLVARPTTSGPLDRHTCGRPSEVAVGE